VDLCKPASIALSWAQGTPEKLRLEPTPEQLQDVDDSKLISWQLVLTAGRCTPQEFSLSCVQLKLV